jgi:hypothetical protein
MRIRPTMTTVPLLVMMLVGPVIQAIGEPSPYVRVAATAKSSRADLAQLQAPIGHRQPTQNDIPPSVRQEEAPSAEANPQQDSQGGVATGKEVGLRSNDERRVYSPMAFHGFAIPARSPGATMSAIRRSRDWRPDRPGLIGSRRSGGTSEAVPSSEAG